MRSHRNRNRENIEPKYFHCAEDSIILAMMAQGVHEAASESSVAIPPSSSTANLRQRKQHRRSARDCYEGYTTVPLLLWHAMSVTQTAPQVPRVPSFFFYGAPETRRRATHRTSAVPCTNTAYPPPPDTSHEAFQRPSRSLDDLSPPLLGVDVWGGCEWASLSKFPSRPQQQKAQQQPKRILPPRSLTMNTK